MGGHASSEVLDKLQMSLIKNSGKTIIGASDITAYLSAWTVSGLPSIHFPTWSGFAGDLPDEYTDVLQKMMRGEIPSYRCQGSEYDIPGSAEGKQIPVAFGFPAGHGNKNYPLLIGAKVRLNVSEDDFTIEWVTPGSLK